MTLTRLVASGASGEVWQGEYHGTTVGVKRLLRSKLTDERILKFYDEIILLSQLNHPFIVLMVGHVAAPPRLYMVSERPPSPAGARPPPACKQPRPLTARLRNPLAPPGA